ncbi:MAG: hypothetical protein QXY55_00250 [Candidatus Korarchaeota archaeon]|nr:hypothetical protein [Thermoproteota archaeon]MCR8487430.1 hypothetical protein [Thermoproteota archaeon]MCR8500928.1 hypothetical protein [Thermoproteota archaeon]
MKHSKELLLEFLKKDPFSRLKVVAKFSIKEILRALNWAAAEEILNTFYELGLDNTLKTPCSTTEVALEHAIEDIEFLHEFLLALVKVGLLDEAAGRFKLRTLARRPKKPEIVDILMKTPMKALFEVIKLTGENIVDVLITAKRELKWLTDAAIAFEPLEFSPQFVALRIKALELLYKMLKEVAKVCGINEYLILTVGLASGFGLVNVAQFFRESKCKIIALDPSEREVKLAMGLLEDFKLEGAVNVETFDISKNLKESSLVAELLKKFSGFDAVISIERWRFYDRIMRSQILANLAIHTAPYSSLVDVDLTREQVTLLNTVLHAIEGWIGFPNIHEKRDMFSLVYQKIKERAKGMIVRADLPLIKEIWM